MNAKTSKAPEEGTQTPSAEPSKTSAAPTQSPDPGTFKAIIASVPTFGSKLHLNIPGLAWSNEFDLGNVAYAARLAAAINNVTTDFVANQPKPTE